MFRAGHSKHQSEAGSMHSADEVGDELKNSWHSVSTAEDTAATVTAAAADAAASPAVCQEIFIFC